MKAGGQREQRKSGQLWRRSIGVPWLAATRELPMLWHSWCMEAAGRRSACAGSGRAGDAQHAIGQAPQHLLEGGQVGHDVLGLPAAHRHGWGSAVR